ncbi:snake venom metalloproteinase rhomb-I-like [Syngnathus scovelli]|uniref:snake venom metalloproteinase rhomb-I-like n=1 Tax=Syngnathus scovelli TaxID=161590 RepID=UPI00210F6B78|nr:zinc metalloproteinase/disintegrin-like [Syngnathus scovelli]
MLTNPLLVLQFLNYEKNNKTIIYRLLDVANQVDWYYRPLKVRVALTGLEVWSDRDKIRVEKNPSATLNFLLWRRRELLLRLCYDNAELLMYAPHLNLAPTCLLMMSRCLSAGRAQGRCLGRHHGGHGGTGVPVLHRPLGWHQRGPPGERPGRGVHGGS